jgi:hypothetical protein
MLWDLVITKPAVRDLRRLPRSDLQWIDAAFEAMRQNPYTGDIKFLVGTGWHPPPTDRRLARFLRSAATAAQSCDSRHQATDLNDVLMAIAMTEIAAPATALRAD